MPRLRYIEESEKSPRTRELIESAKRTGAPDPRVVSLMTRSQLGIAWVEYWNKLLYQGTLPHKLKEMCRIKISVAHQCGYCSTVRSTVAKALVLLVIVGNAAWTLGSVALLFSGAVSPNLLGQVFVVAQAIATGVFAELQYIGLRKSDQTVAA